MTNARCPYYGYWYPDSACMEMCVTGTSAQPMQLSTLQVVFRDYETDETYIDWADLNGYTGGGTETICITKVVPKAFISSEHTGDSVNFNLYDDAGK